MTSLPLCLIIVNLVSFHSLNIDIDSIELDPTLFKLCWKQNMQQKLNYLIGENSNAETFEFPVFSDVNRYGYYCIVKRDINSTYKVKFPIEEENQKLDLSIELKFFLPLGPPYPFIRKKRVSKGVHFQLHHIFAGILNEKSSILCNGIISYYIQNSMTIKLFKMDSSKNAKRFIEMDPGSTFKFYYSCSITEWGLSSSFIADRGVVFPKEETSPLESFIQFPFRRFLISEWIHLKSYSKSYYAIISEVSESGKETCLKMFRLCSPSELKTGTLLKIDVPSRCSKNIVMEDIGNYNEGSNIRAVLDMVNPLKANAIHKFTILYQNISTNKIQENFIYFETMPNENSGFIHPDIYKYQPLFKNDYMRNETSTMNQLLLSDFPDNPVNKTSLSISKFLEKEIIQSVSVIRGAKTNASGPLDYNDILQECGSSCKEGIYPYFYVILRKEGVNNKIEIIALPKPTNAEIGIPQMTGDSKTYKFTISWNITNYPHGVTPSFFAVKMIKQESSLTCSSLYILKCKTCNQVAQLNLKHRIGNLTNWCKNIMIVENHYEANAKLITFTTPEMTPEVNFQAEVIPFQLYGEGQAKSSLLNFIKESFWNRGGYILTIAAVLVVVLIVFISMGLGLKYLSRNTIKEDKDDKNTYYYEEEGV